MATSPTARTHPGGSATFNKAARILAKPQFNRVFDAKASAGDPNLIVHAAPSRIGAPRLGLAVSKKAGNSVRRNRIKRVIREVFRTERNGLPPVDAVVLARGPATATDLPSLRASLLLLIPKAAGRIRDEE